MGCSGNASWAATALFATPIWIITSLSLAGRFMVNPIKFCKRTDRSKKTIPDPVAGLDHKYYTINGVKIHAATHGIGTGKKLMLLLHGFPECWYSWRHQIEGFKNDYEVVAIDMRGYGLSGKPKGVKHYQMKHLCSDISGIIAATGHKSCTLVAHDWGGAVAWNTAANYPHLIDQLVILCSPHPAAYKDPVKFNSDQMKKSWYFMLFMGRGLPELWIKAGDYSQLDTLMAKAVRHPGAITDDDMYMYKQSLSRKGSLTAAINYYRAAIGEETCWKPSQTIEKTLSTKLTMPVLVLYAENDAAFGLQMFHDYEEYGSDITTVVLPNCSHWAQQDLPVQVNTHIKAFLNLYNVGGTKKIN